jgi:alkylation response protein AidB-like acyl-CoA dehydrogenase
MRQLAELGVLGMAVPLEYGGLGLPVFDTALVLEEIAAMVRFLVGPEGRYITGQTIHVNGGLFFGK